MMSDENQQTVQNQASDAVAPVEEVEDFSALLAENEQAMETKTFEKGMIVEGVIVQIGPE